MRWCSSCSALLFVLIGFYPFLLKAQQQSQAEESLNRPLEDPALQHWDAIVAYRLEQQDEEGALEACLQALETVSGDNNARITASYLLTRIGNRKARLEQTALFSQALDLARAAVSAEPDNARAQLVLAISLGRIALVAPARDRMRFSLEIGAAAAKALELDSTLPGALHVYGLWQYRMATLSAAEMESAKALYGQVPRTGSTETSLSYLKKAVEAEPDFLLYRYDLARILWHLRQTEEARAQLEILLELPESMVDDVPLKLKAREMLARP